MFDDLIKTIKSQLYDRVVSPLFSCFAISWVGWNYKFILVVLSTMNVDVKINYIESNIFATKLDVILNCFSYPLLTALCIIYIYPYPAKYAYEFYRKRQVELKTIQQAIDDNMPLTREEARKIRKDAISMNIEFESEIEKLREENISLRLLLKPDTQIDDNSFDKVSNGVGTESSEEINVSYSPLFKGGDKNEQFMYNENRVLVTAQELVKITIENFIREDDVFDGHSFMVSVSENKLSITLMSRKNKGGAIFKYDFTIPSDGRVGYEILRIKRSFKEDLIKFLNKANRMGEMDKVTEDVIN